MTAAARQANYRKRIKEQGMVDVRVEIPVIQRDIIKTRAKANKRTIKAEIREAINNHLSN